MDVEYLNYFSVIIPLYNKEDYIKNTINSVLSQTYDKFEIIVLNDGSTDGSEAVVRSIKDDRIRIINQENRGVSAARNTAIQNAKYEYVCLLDADDKWTSDFLQEISELLTEFHKHKIFSVRHKIIEKDGTTIFPSTGLPRNFRGEIENFIKLFTHHDGLIQSSSVCLEKKFFQSLGGFPVGQDNGEDIYLWLLYGLKTNYIFSDKICSIYCRDIENSSIERKVYKKLPFQFEYFLSSDKSIQTKDLKYYLRHSALLHIAGLKTFNETNLAIKHSLQLFRNSILTGLLCLFVAILPNFVLKVMRLFRNYIRKYEK